MYLNTEILRKFEADLKAEFLAMWVAQGHYMNGKIVEDMDILTKTTAEVLNMGIYVYPYGVYMEAGVTANKIPFAPGSGKKTSLYISALIRYVQKRMGISEMKKAKSIAFAIAHTQKKQGMPTRESYRFSNSGMRTNWIQETMNKNENLITTFVNDIFGHALEVSLDNMILEIQRTIT